MPLAIPNTTLTTDYADATFSGIDIFESGFFVIANASAAVQMFAGMQGQANPYPEMFLAPGTYPLRSGRRDPVAGIRFKSFIDPVPSPAPQVFGTLFYPGDAIIEAGSPFDTVVSASGSITPGGGGVTELAYQEVVAPVAIAGGTAEGTAVLVVSSGVVTLDGTTKVVVEGWFPSYQVGGAGSPPAIQQLWSLYRNGASVGVIGGYGATFVGQPMPPIYLAREITPAAGASTFEWRAFTPQAAGSTVTAGAGGVGAYLPGFIRVSEVA